MRALSHSLKGGALIRDVRFAQRMRASAVCPEANLPLVRGESLPEPHGTPAFIRERELWLSR